MESWGVSVVLELFKDFIPCAVDSAALSVGECKGKDGIGIVGVHNKDVVVATARLYGETACLVGVRAREVFCRVKFRRNAHY